jgi:hypothetical protein
MTANMVQKTATQTMIGASHVLIKDWCVSAGLRWGKAEKDSRFSSVLSRQSAFSLSGRVAFMRCA